jgi:hypothetical protein
MAVTREAIEETMRNLGVQDHIAHLLLTKEERIKELLEENTRLQYCDCGQARSRGLCVICDNDE